MASPDDRQTSLNRLLDALRSDDRVAGVLIVGSGAVGFADAYSDIDLAVVVHTADAVQPTYADWFTQVKALLPVRLAFESPRGPNQFLFGLLLDNFLEIDASFQCLDDLVARRARWQVAFDHTDRIADIMRQSWAERESPDVQIQYLRWVRSIWYYVTHVVIHVRRGHLWRAVLDLEDLRHRAVILAGLRAGLETEHYREVHRLPPDFLAELEGTLVNELNADSIMLALQAAMGCFFREARALDELLGVDEAAPVEAAMQDYLANYAP